jgi:hypothetical protein
MGYENLSRNGIAASKATMVSTDWIDWASFTQLASTNAYAAVPEPTCVGLLILASTALLRRHRRGMEHIDAGANATAAR